MSKFNPDFWEVVVARARLEAFANEDALWQASAESPDQRGRYEQRTREALRQVMDLMRTELTQRQREVVQLYYFEGLTEAEVGNCLGIPQQVVGQHLHGVVRDGRRVGGAIAKLKKLCEKRGIHW